MLNEELSLTPAKGVNPTRHVSSQQTKIKDHYWQFCVNCGTKLEGRKCKLICPRCGFYHSCSEP